MKTLAELKAYIQAEIESCNGSFYVYSPEDRSHYNSELDGKIRAYQEVLDWIERNSKEEYPEADRDKD